MNAKDVISKLGRKRLIVALGVSTAQISNCINDERFPAHWFDVMDKMASIDGWEMPRRVFSWKRVEDAA